MFRSISHFLHSQHFPNEGEENDSVKVIFDSKGWKCYTRGFKRIDGATRWLLLRIHVVFCGNVTHDAYQPTIPKLLSQFEMI